MSTDAATDFDAALDSLRGQAAEAARDGDLIGALALYQQALSLAPEGRIDLFDDLGHLSLQMREPSIAEGFFRQGLALDPASNALADGLAQALAAQHRYDDAVDVLRTALMATPEEARLWNTLGVVMTGQGDSERAQVFFDEALRLSPNFAAALYHRAGAAMDQGRVEEALADCDAALAMLGPGPDHDRQRGMMRLARSMMLLALGRLAEGWLAYEARRDPHLPDAAEFDIPLAPLAPNAPLNGAHLLVMGEQGLGDEVLFASLITDLLRELGPSGHLTLAVEPRLKPLFARSFPEADITTHATLRQAGRTIRRLTATVDANAWTPIAALAARYRPDIRAFPNRGAYLKPDPERIAYWKGLLDQSPGPKIGLTWRSGLLQGERRRQYPPLNAWRGLLATRDVSWVQLQYGFQPDEAEALERDSGLKLWSPPDLDLHRDLDDLAALCCALDLVIGCANATTNLAGACGAPLWLILAAGGWPQLGTDRYPWYPQARVFARPQFAGDGAEGWRALLDQASNALRSEFSI